MSLPRVLLVEDDTSIARFVQMALEELPIELVTCTNVPDAMQALRDSNTQLIITDLMLPGESGIDLVQRLLNDPGLERKIPVAVFSAGLTPSVREQLDAMKVWRMVSKPASVAALEDCVREALALTADALASPAPAPAPAPAPPPAANLAKDTDVSDAQAHAIETHFAGDQVLFKAYRARCLQQFPSDVLQGDTACASQDWAALRRLAHSLATVLLTLGYPTESARARQLENAAANLITSQCREHWNLLRSFLNTL